MPGIATSSHWVCALELDRRRAPVGGSCAELCDAVRRGADLRVYTEFLHEEHIAPYSCTSAAGPENNGLIREVIDFRETILVDGRHAAGVTLLRQPLEPTTGFNGTQPKMSFFLYNMDGRQACANLLLDASPVAGRPGTKTEAPATAEVPKMSRQEVFDVDTTGPSRNFVYDMEVYRFFVRDDWTELLAHDRQGRVESGSFAAVEQAQIEGREIKVGLRELCADLGDGPAHEVFSLVGSGFVHTGRRFYEALSHPLVRVAPGVPLQYRSFGWDVTWVFARTDGFAVLRTLNPYTRTFQDRETRLACRWFAR